MQKGCSFVRNIENDNFYFTSVVYTMYVAIQKSDDASFIQCKLQHYQNNKFLSQKFLILDIYI
jgi:hypothetical protein